MQIVVYGAPGCSLCDAAKEKIVRLGFEYVSRDISVYLDPHTGWDEDGSTDIMAIYQQTNSYPVIQITQGEFEWFGTYPESMPVLKHMKKTEEK